MTTIIFAIYLQDERGVGMAVAYVVLILLIVFIAISIGKIGDRKRKEVAAAKAAYENSLSNLKVDPSNPNLRQSTLGLGRIYSNLTRNKQGVTLFDEVALMNDINAVCARASIPASPTKDLPAPLPSGFASNTSFQAASSIEERLDTLSGCGARA